MLKQITKQEFLSLYEDGELWEVVGPIEVSGEKRLIGRTPRGAANEDKGYFIVYVVV